MSVKGKLNAIVAAYRQLVDANRSFIEQGCSVDAFRILIEQRNLIIEDLDLLARELITTIATSYTDHPFSGSQSLPETVRSLPVLAPELQPQCDEIRKIVKELVESDKQVEQNISALKDEVKAELGRIRQGSKGLKGYRQTESFGSCFINKIK
jgi:hypothetical protein